jgi:hypothetical protein
METLHSWDFCFLWDANVKSVAKYVLFYDFLATFLLWVVEQH